MPAGRQQPPRGGRTRTRRRRPSRAGTVRSQRPHISPPEISHSRSEAESMRSLTSPVRPSRCTGSRCCSISAAVTACAQATSSMGGSYFSRLLEDPVGGPLAGPGPPAGTLYTCSTTSSGRSQPAVAERGGVARPARRRRRPSAAVRPCPRSGSRGATSRRYHGALRTTTGMSKRHRLVVQRRVVGDRATDARCRTSSGSGRRIDVREFSTVPPAVTVAGMASAR